MKTTIEDFELKPLENAEYIATSRACYVQDGVAKDWEIVKAFDSVAILIYHRQKDAFVLVKQFRPAVYAHNGCGITYELCAGLVDKQKSLKQIAKEEIEEECGYEVGLDAIEKITSYYSAVGFAGAKQTLYYAEVEESMRVSEGGGIDKEKIELEFLPTSSAKQFLYNEELVRTPGLLFGFMWWFERH